jgi:RND family efflux transporter MFP subunit
MSKFATKIIAVGMVCSLLSGCGLLPTEEGDMEPPLAVPAISDNVSKLKTVKVQRQDLVEKKEIAGALVSESSVSLLFKGRSGFIKTINVKKGTQVKKGDLLIQLDTDQAFEQIEGEELQLKILKLDYDKLKSQPNPDSYDLKKMELYIQAQELKIKKLKETIEENSLYATIDGIVMDMALNPLNTTISVGDYVQANTPLVTIMDTKAIVIESNGDVSSFKLLQKVSIVKNDMVYSGEVIDVKITSSTNDQPQGVMRVKYDKLPEDLRLGDGVRIELVKSNKENVLAIPRQCVNNYNGGNFVQVLENDVKREISVELGLETATMVEVKSGLKEGDLVIAY